MLRDFDLWPKGFFGGNSMRFEQNRGNSGRVRTCLATFSLDSIDFAKSQNRQNHEAIQARKPAHSQKIGPISLAP
jgi:hypothetical protein